MKDERKCVGEKLAAWEKGGLPALLQSVNAACLSEGKTPAPTDTVWITPKKGIWNDWKR